MSRKNKLDHQPTCLPLTDASSPPSPPPSPLPPPETTAFSDAAHIGGEVVYPAGHHGVVDKPLFVARGVSAFRGDQPALLLDAPWARGGVGPFLVPLLFGKGAGERGFGAERVAI